MRWRALAAGALFIVAVGACSGSGGGSGGSGGDGRPAPATEAASGYHSPGEPTPLGPGLLEGVSRDGSAVYVSARDAALSKAGCGSAPEPVLFRVPLAGGGREPLRVRSEPATGTIVPGSDGRLALVGRCQGTLTAPRLGTETADGRLDDVRNVDLGPVAGLTALAWSADGQSLLTARRAEARSPSSVARVDPQSGASTPLFEVTGGVSQVAQLAEGTYVVSSEGKVTLRTAGGGVRSTVDGDGFAVAPDRRAVAVWGRSLLLLRADDPSAVTLASPQGEQSFGPADFSPDGTAVAYATSVPGGGALAVVTLDDRRVTGFSAVPGRPLRVMFTADGKSVAFSHAPADKPDEPAVVSVRFRA